MASSMSRPPTGTALEMTTPPSDSIRKAPPRRPPRLPSGSHRLPGPRVDRHQRGFVEDHASPLLEHERVGRTEVDGEVSLAHEAEVGRPDRVTSPSPSGPRRWPAAPSSRWGRPP